MTYSGADIELMQTMSKKMKFTYKLKPMTGFGKTVHPSSSKYTVTSVIGSVQHGTSDFGTGHLSMALAGNIDDIETYRMAASDMIYLYDMQPRYITTKPKRINPLTNIIKPFRSLYFPQGE